jgi:DNA-binding GntR family transcriptional regulator
MSIQRRSLRTQIKEEVLRRLAAGEFELGQDVNEVRLAAELGVSRTPLREALIALENERVTENRMGKGFRWAPVSIAEFRELTVVLAALEALAVESTPVEYLKTLAPELIAQADAYGAPAEHHASIINYDDAWHELLLSGCPNRRLLDLIGTLKVALRRYEALLAGDDATLATSAAEHRRLAEHLGAGEVTAAVTELKANWTNGIERVLEAMRAAEEL